MGKKHRTDAVAVERSDQELEALLPLYLERDDDAFEAVRDALQPEQVLRHVPVPRPKIQPKAYRPGFTPRAMTPEQRRLAESWMWTPGYSRPGE